ncbi:MAG: hypothetical protein M1830_010191 [Pleopsidium flavum]|nr:MAG: hypothetical protein M1830_010191 [Pleopsidium flavum]
MEFNFTLVFVGQCNTMEGLNKEPHIILGDQFIDEQLRKYESDAQNLFTSKDFHIDNEGVRAFSDMTSKSGPSEAVDRLRPITSGKMLKVMPSDGYLQDTAKPGVA